MTNVRQFVSQPRRPEYGSELDTPCRAHRAAVANFHLDTEAMCLDMPAGPLRASVCAVVFGEDDGAESVSDSIRRHLDPDNGRGCLRLAAGLAAMARGTVLARAKDRAWEKGSQSEIPLDGPFREAERLLADQLREARNAAFEA